MAGPDVTSPLAPFSGMSVLAIDDNPDNLLLVRAILEQQGMNRVHTESDSTRLVERLTESRPDLVLLDLHMPHVDGFEALNQIRQFAGGAFLPVLVLTADSTSEARNQALASGADDFLSKPIDVIEVVLRVANLLRTRALYVDLRREDDRDRYASTSASQATRDRISDVLANRAVVPVFQPIVDLEMLIIVGYEGLSRFADASFGGPDRWFADAFDVGLGVDLEWMAASEVVRHLDDLASDQFLSVNMSPATVLHLVDRELLPAAACPRIVVELTEHVPVEDYAAVQNAFAALRSHGARMAADDLGSGYAGFRHLTLLQPDIVKLDIALVAGIHRSREQRALVRALLSFADEVGSVVIAEGIEDEAEAAALKDLGVRWGQGYLLGRPAPLPVRDE